MTLVALNSSVLYVIGFQFSFNCLMKVVVWAFVCMNVHVHTLCTCTSRHFKRNFESNRMSEQRLTWCDTICVYILDKFLHTHV
jgi:hypothetical protein